MSKLMGVRSSCSRVATSYREVIILCVRWYLRFKQSLRDLVEMMAENRGPVIAGTYDHYALGVAIRTRFEKRWKRFAQAVGR